MNIILKIPILIIYLSTYVFIIFSIFFAFLHSINYNISKILGGIPRGICASTQIKKVVEKVVVLYSSTQNSSKY